MYKSRYPWLAHINVLGWDLDGTLYPNNPEMSAQIKRLRQEKVAAFFDGNKLAAESEYQRIYEQLGSHTKTLTQLGLNGADFFVDMWDELDLSNYIKPDPHIVTLFHKLSSKRHFLLSNSNRVEQIKHKLSLIGLEASVFETIVSTVDVGAVKPDPEPFNQAFKNLKNPPLDEIMYIGDRLSTDVTGAHNAGIKAALVWAHDPAADVCFDTVYQVGEVIGVMS